MYFVRIWKSRPRWSCFEIVMKMEWQISVRLIWCEVCYVNIKVVECWKGSFHWCSIARSESLIFQTMRRRIYPFLLEKKNRIPNSVERIWVTDIQVLVLSWNLVQLSNEYVIQTCQLDEVFRSKKKVAPISIQIYLSLAGADLPANISYTYHIHIKLVVPSRQCLFTYYFHSWGRSL